MHLVEQAGGPGLSTYRSEGKASGPRSALLGPGGPELPCCPLPASVGLGLPREVLP